jgi:hypothetical protein
MIAICCFPWQSIAQTGLKVICQDGSEQLFSIAETGDIHFESNHLIISENEEAVSVSIPFAVAQKIVFTSPVMHLPTNATDNRYFSIYPNPAKDYIAIAGDAEGNLEIKIRSLSGQLLLSEQLTPDEKINVSHLPSGFYLVQVNEKTLKFSKL